VKDVPRAVAIGKAELLQHSDSDRVAIFALGALVPMAEEIARKLEGEGIPTRTFALDPKRANLVARLKGNGSKRPILILAHTDVVGVQPEKWPVAPFGAVLKDGYIWGRGSRDDQDKLAANLMVMLLLKRSKAQLDRDVIFLAESGEEGTNGPGIDYMVGQHFDEINAAFTLSEGGGATLDGSRVKVVGIATTEKVPRRVRLVVNGTSGHGSVPRVDNALVHLSAAVAKIGTWETPMRLNDTTRAYFDLSGGNADAPAPRGEGDQHERGDRHHHQEHLRNPPLRPRARRVDAPCGRPVGERAVLVARRAMGLLLHRPNLARSLPMPRRRARQARTRPRDGELVDGAQGRHGGRTPGDLRHARPENRARPVDRRHSDEGSPGARSRAAGSPRLDRRIPRQRRAVHACRSNDVDAGRRTTAPFMPALFLPARVLGGTSTSSNLPMSNPLSRAAASAAPASTIGP
jgi:acetylornithine deacetylase/succinyl-diaminopimelate desuccinylase-like protein